MKFLKFFLVGILFGIVLTKSEAISWYRIQEMFLFESFHMYGIIGTAVGFGLIWVSMAKRFGWKDIYGEPLKFQPKKLNSYYPYLFGGTIFGLGWAMTGACPGPLYVLLGHGIWIIAVVIISAVIGTYCYGALRDLLPK